MRTTLLAISLLFLPRFAHAESAETPEPPNEESTSEEPPNQAAAAAPDPPERAVTEPASKTPGATPTADSPTPTPTPAPPPPAAPEPAPGKSTRAASPPDVARRGAASGDENDWKFSYHGYLRAPMRVGFGKRLPEDSNGYTVTGQSDTTIHEATVPDDQYLSFQSTSHNMRSWAEGFFSFGNAFARGTLGIASYNLTNAGFSDPEANLGIASAFVELTPDLGYENVRLWAKAGAISDKYGMSGRYDAGEYDTYMFGRTKVMGATAHVDYDLSDVWTLSLEGGAGAHKPDPSQHNNARFTMLHHEHVGLRQGRNLEFGAHYLYTWSQEEFRPFNGNADETLAPRNGLPTGKLWVFGGEARAELGAFGYLYGAYSHVGASYALTVSRSIEVLHASGGGEFDLGVAGNYLDSPNCLLADNGVSNPTAPPPPQAWAPLDPNGCSDGNGSIDALHAQYEFSLTNFRQQIAGGQRFWGDGFDAILKLYGLVAFVDSEARDTTRVPVGGDLSADSPQGYTITKLKYGADLTVQALPWLSPALRFDRVEPNSRVPEQSFAILSPRLQFKTRWVTHERITLGYSRYFYDQRVCDPVQMPIAPGSSLLAPNIHCVQPPPSPVPYDGFGSSYAKQDPDSRSTGVRRPDENVFKIEATMWW